MVKKEVFICDNCRKQSPSITEGTDFPYVQGWRSLTSFEFKISSEYKHEAILKHFCSNACMLACMEKFVYEQEDLLQHALLKNASVQIQEEKPFLKQVMR